MIAYNLTTSKMTSDEVLCQDELIKQSIEIIPNQLYWFTSKLEPKSDPCCKIVNIDRKYIYQAYNHDFGPLNISMTVQYIREMREMVMTHTRAGGRDPTKKVIFHNCSPMGMFAANSATLMGAYMIMELGFTAEDAWKKFSKMATKLLPFSDSGKVPIRFELRVPDVLKAIEAAKNRGWFNINTFDIAKYDKMNKLDEGDLNWIIPGRVVATSSPAINNSEGLPPRFYCPIFRENNITAVIRLNERLYNDVNFTNKGFRVYPMEFKDGSCPDDIHVIDFIKILENEVDLRKAAVAVHCRAGLGRTGTLIACYLMYKHGLKPKEAIGWIRLCRPGSVVGMQQQFLVDIQPRLKKLMQETGEKEMKIKHEFCEGRPYAHVAKECTQKCDGPLYKPKKYQRQLDQVYEEINQVQRNEYKLSDSGSRYDRLNHIGSQKEGFNPAYNRFSSTNDRVLIQKNNTRSDNLDDYKKTILNSFTLKYAKNIENINRISNTQYDRVRFLASEKGQGRLTEKDPEIKELGFPSPIGTHLTYKKKHHQDYWTDLYERRKKIAARMELNIDAPLPRDQEPPERGSRADLQNKLKSLK